MVPHEIPQLITKKQHHTVPQIIKRKKITRKQKSHGSPWDSTINHKETTSHGSPNNQKEKNHKETKITWFPMGFHN
jgi:hypothetical protein